MARFKVSNPLAALPSVQLKDIGIAIALIAAAVVIISQLLKGKGKGKHIKRDYDRDNVTVDPEAFAATLQNRLSGWNFWTGPRAEVLEQLNGFNDDTFIAVYRAYNSAYATPPDSLRTLIEGEWLWDAPFSDGVLSQLQERFNRLQLP